MALDLPLSPSLNDIHTGANGINYQWDGEKWVVYIDANAGTNVWERDPSTTTISPIAAGDTVAATDGGGTETIKLIGTTGTVEADNFAIDQLTDLP